MNFWKIFALCYASIGLGLILGSTLKKCDNPNATNTPLIAGIANLVIGVGIFVFTIYRSSSGNKYVATSNYNLNTYK